MGRFKENKVALLAGIILLVLIFFIIFGPAISGYGYEKIDSGAINQGPSAHIGSEQMTLDVICLPEYGRRDVSLF